MRYVAFLTLLMFLAPLRTSAQTPVEAQDQGSPVKPAVSVSFERQTIRENDAVEVHVWFANEWDHDLSSVVLHIDAPSSLRWNASACEEWKKKSYQGELAQRTLDMSAVRAHEVRTATLCVNSESDIIVGDFNILFTFDYAWQQGNVTQHSFVTSEKTLKANLFGSDTVAGVPLALAGFIVPGLFFWLVVSWLKLPWGLEGLALGDKLLFSILVSFPIVFFVNKLKFPDVNSGISLIKLLIYAGAGAFAGIFFGGLDKLRRLSKQRTADEQARLAKEKQVKFGDGELVLLGKLLNQYPDYRKPKAIVRLEDGTEYIGSLAAKSDEATALVGWFQIEKDKVTGDNREEIIQQLNQAQRSVDLFNLAREHNLQISISDTITKEKDDISEQQVDGHIILSNDVAVVKELSQDQAPNEPLVLV